MEIFVIGIVGFCTIIGLTTLMIGATVLIQEMAERR